MSDRDMFDELLDLANEDHHEACQTPSATPRDHTGDSSDDPFGPDRDHPDWNDDRDPWTSSNENPDGEQPHEHSNVWSDASPGYGPLELKTLRRHLQNQDDDGAWVATDTHGHAWKIPRPADVDAP